MKLTIVILAMVAVVAVQSTTTKVADKEFLMKVKFLYDIMNHIDEPLMVEELIKRGENLVVDKSHYLHYDNWMIRFYDTYKAGSLLPQGEFFSAVSKYHIRQAWGLFDFFYNAKDWDTFVDNVVWARINVNKGMFVYALTLAVIHRPDMQGMMMPMIYEIFPEMFFNSKLIMEAEKFNWESWNKQIMYEKKWASIYEKKHVKNIHGKYWHMKDWKMWQWWKLMGLDEEWHMEEKCILRENVEILKNDSKWTALWHDMNMMWMPVDYTRDIEIFNEDSKLSYFTEDLGWNAYWYYLNMDYAMILDSKHFNLNKDRRGEWWVFNVKQMLARYTAERLSHGLGDVAELSWHGHVATGYDSELIGYNGVAFTLRQNYWDIQEHENYELLNKIMNIDRRIDDVIASGKYVTHSGDIIDLMKPEALEHIGNMMQGNMDLVDRMFFGYWLSLASVYLSGHEYHDMTLMPNTFLNYETAMRDPLFYHLLKRIVHVEESFSRGLPSYKHDELLMDGVQITDVHVDKLMTYFDLVDFDVSNLLNDKMLMDDGHFAWNKTLLARQMRLNHKPYNLEIHVQADKPQNVLIRTFMAPDFDEFGQKINLMEHRENLVKIDAFVYNLVAGENVIKRSSKDYTWTTKDRPTYTEMYKLVMLALEGKNELPLDISEPHCGFPGRLLLPRGWVKGMPMKMFFMVTPLHESEPVQPSYDASYMCGIGSGTRHIDNLPFSYPFDRLIESFVQFSVPNMFWKDVKIYHVDKFEKYRDHKYEHFGTFDYHFN